MSDTFSIMFYNLNPETQARLLEAAGLETAEDTNWDTFAIAEVPLGEDDEAVNEIAQQYGQ